MVRFFGAGRRGRNKRVNSADDAATQKNHAPPALLAKADSFTELSSTWSADSWTKSVVRHHFGEEWMHATTTKAPRVVTFANDVVSRVVTSRYAREDLREAGMWYTADELREMRGQAMLDARLEAVTDFEQDQQLYARTLYAVFQSCATTTTTTSTTTCIPESQRTLLRSVLRTHGDERLGLERHLSPTLEKEVMKRRTQLVQLLQRVQATSENKGNPDDLAAELGPICARMTRPARTFATVVAQEYALLAEQTKATVAGKCNER